MSSKQETYLTTCAKKAHAGQISFFNLESSRNPTEAIVLRQHRLLSVALIFDFVPNIKPATWSDCRNLGEEALKKETAETKKGQN